MLVSIIVLWPCKILVTIRCRGVKGVQEILCYLCNFSVSIKLTSNKQTKTYKLTGVGWTAGSKSFPLVFVSVWEGTLVGD